MRGPALATVLALLAVTSAGCADPYTTDRASTPPGTPPSSPAEPGDIERPGPPAGPVPSAHDRRSRSAEHAARTFAIRWINWDWQSAAQQQRAMARLAAGELAHELQTSARSVRLDASLTRDKPGSRGQVEAIDLQAGNEHRQGIVVTLERTYTGGRADLGGRRYRVYRVRLARTGDRWGVSAWQPQP